MLEEMPSLGDEESQFDLPPSQEYPECKICNKPITDPRNIFQNGNFVAHAVPCSSAPRYVDTRAKALNAKSALTQYRKENSTIYKYQLQDLANNTRDRRGEETSG